MPAVAFVVNPDVTAPDTAVVGAYAGHQGAAIAQVVLTQGAAAVALAMVVLALRQPFQLISRIDGAKMLLLAVLAAAGMALARRARALPATADLPRHGIDTALAALAIARPGTWRRRSQPASEAAPKTIARHREHPPGRSGR